jgi:hypothetical protein
VHNEPFMGWMQLLFPKKLFATICTWPNTPS